MSAVLWSKLGQKEVFSVKPLVFTTQDWVWSLQRASCGATSNGRQVQRTHAEFLKASGLGRLTAQVPAQAQMSVQARGNCRHSQTEARCWAWLHFLAKKTARAPVNRNLSQPIKTPLLIYWYGKGKHLPKSHLIYKGIAQIAFAPSLLTVFLPDGTFFLHFDRPFWPSEGQDNYPLKSLPQTTVLFDTTASVIVIMFYG